MDILSSKTLEMITDSQIEQSIAALETSGDDIFVESSIWEYMLDEVFPNLLKDEKEIFVFCINAISKSIEDHHKASDQIDLERYISNEEKNWEFRDKDKKWEDTLDAFFKNYPQEDLLAFVEDMLVDDDDQQVSTAGKEIILISCKSYIDCIIS